MSCCLKTEVNLIKASKGILDDRFEYIEGKILTNNIWLKELSIPRVIRQVGEN